MAKERNRVRDINSETDWRIENGRKAIGDDYGKGRKQTYSKKKYVRVLWETDSFLFHRGSNKCRCI